VVAQPARPRRSPAVAPGLHRLRQRGSHAPSVRPHLRGVRRPRPGHHRQRRRPGTRRVAAQPGQDPTSIPVRAAAAPSARRRRTPRPRWLSCEG
jgi:hypothetical protein